MNQPSPSETHGSSDSEAAETSTFGELCESSTLRQDRAAFEALMGQISHALQEPVRAICSFSRLIKPEDLTGADAHVREYLDFISRGARQIEFSMQGWVRLAHVVTRAQPAVPVDLRSCLDTAVALLRKSINETNVTFAIGPLPSVLAPPNHVVALFREISVNSIASAHVEPLSISVTAETQGGRVRVTISDNGRGFEPGKLRRFDQIFPREESDHLGFGLAVCHQIVTRTNGTLDIDSKPDYGTTIRFDLPAASSTGRA